MRPATALFLAVLISAGPALAQDQTTTAPADEAEISDAEIQAATVRGKDLARLLCSRCHDIEGAGPSPNDKAPPFRNLIERLSVEGIADQILEGLPLGHDPMPKWEFSEDQAAELILYIDSITPP